MQTALRFGVVVFDPADADPQAGWLAAYRTAIHALTSTPGMDFAFRISLRERKLERALFIMASEARVEDLKTVAGRLLKLNVMSEGSVQFCADREQHDELAASFPMLRYWAQNETHMINDCQLACNFRLFPQLEWLFDSALHRDWNVSVQFNIRRYQPTDEDLRFLRKNLVRINSANCLPERVAALQRRITQQLEGAQFLLDQFIGFETAAARDFILERISDDFAADHGRLGFPCPLIEDSTDSFAELITTGIHSAVVQESEPMAKATSASTRDEIERVLRWQPPETHGAQQLANTIRVSATERDYLRRIESKLQSIELALQTRNVATGECAELKKALSISRADPPFALVKTRQILEGIVERVYRDRKEGQPVKPLFNMIDELTEDRKVFPRKIATYLHTLRVLGNLVAHGGPAKVEGPDDYKAVSETDVEITLLMTLNLVEWYLFEYTVPT